MKTAMINGKKVRLKYRASSGYYTLLSPPGAYRSSLYGANIYFVSGDDCVVIVPVVGHNGEEIRSGATVVSADTYAGLANQFDPCDGIRFHRAVMKHIGYV